MNAYLALTQWVHHSNDSAVLCDPKNRIFLHRAIQQTILDDVPAKIVKASDMPAQLAALVSQEHLAQELADTPEILFILVWAHL